MVCFGNLQDKHMTETRQPYLLIDSLIPLLGMRLMMISRNFNTSITVVAVVVVFVIGLRLLFTFFTPQGPQRP